MMVGILGFYAMAQAQSLVRELRFPGTEIPQAVQGGQKKKKKSTPLVLQRILLLLEPTLGLKSST